MDAKIKTLEELKGIVEELRSQGKKIVWTNGCFDILHKAHIALFREASKLGDTLVVGLNSDESVRKLKGPTRPINSQDSRAEVLAALAPIHYVTIFNELTVKNCLSVLKPHIFAKGEGWTISSLDPGEKEALEEYGGKIHIISHGIKDSTTGIIEKIKDQAI